MAGPDYINRLKGVVRTDMYCHDCGKVYVAALNFDLEGNHIVLCPRCGHQHCRVIEKGVVTGTRWDSRYKRVDVGSESVWGAEGMKTSVASKFLRDKWLSGGG